jgi:hypothetical protein
MIGINAAFAMINQMEKRASNPSNPTDMPKSIMYTSTVSGGYSLNPNVINLPESARPKPPTPAEETEKWLNEKLVMAGIK